MPTCACAYWLQTRKSHKAHSTPMSGTECVRNTKQTNGNWKTKIIYKCVYVSCGKWISRKNNTRTQLRMCFLIDVMHIQSKSRPNLCMLMQAYIDRYWFVIEKIIITTKAERTLIRRKQAVDAGNKYDLRLAVRNVSIFIASYLRDAAATVINYQDEPSFLLFIRSLVQIREMTKKKCSLFIQILYLHCSINGEPTTNAQQWQ